MKANNPITAEETASSLTGRARTDARHALRVLSETAEPPAGEDDVPPLPAELRDQWQETYGEAAPPAAPAGTRENWLRRLAGCFARPRAAWAGGLAAAAAVIVLLLPSPESSPGPDLSPGIITRGGSHGTVTGTASRVIVVAPAARAAALLAELARAFPARSIECVDAAPAHPEAEAIIIDAVARTIRRGGAVAEPLDGDPFTAPAAVIMAVESLDEPEPR